MPDFLPSAKVILRLRLEEFDGKIAAPPTKSTTRLKGSKTNRNALVVVPDPTQPRRFLLQSSAASSAVPGQQRASSADGLTHEVVGVIPKEASWSQNGIRAADQLDLTIRFLDLPLDPRVIRSCAVLFYLGTVTPSDHAAGIEGGQRQRVAGSSASNTLEPLHVVPDAYVDDRGRARTNLRFEGWVDEWEVETNDDGEPTVRLQCRDNTQLFIDEEMPGAKTLDRKKPIHQAVADFLADYPANDGLAVEYRSDGASPPTLQAALQKSAYAPQLGPPPSKGGGAENKLSIWDYLTDVCGAIGHLIRVEGTTVIIETVRSLTTKGRVVRSDDPFTGRVYNDVPYDYRRFIYGRNLKSFKLTRKYASKTPQNIEVRCYNGDHGGTLVVRFPEPKDRVKYALPGDSQPDQKWSVRIVQGVADKKILKLHAQDIYESQSRQEIQVELETNDLATLGGNNLDPDLLDMKAMDTFEVLTARSDDLAEANSFMSIEDLQSLARKNAEQLQRRWGFSQRFASALAKAYVASGYQTTFRMSQMRVDWSCDEGVSFSVTGVNYIEVRADAKNPDLPPGIGII